MTCGRSFLFGSIILLAAPVSATTINYSVANIAANNWEYTYSVSNDTLGVAIEEFTVFFDASLFENLTLVGSPAGWDSLVVDPDLDLPDDGFFDSCSSSVFCAGAGNAIPVGGALGGFSISFDFLGVGTPGGQVFDIVDPETFDTIDSGMTTAVPVPAAGWLFGSSLVLLGCLRRSMHFMFPEISSYA